MDQDPAPALTRGLALLRQLESDGRCSLEQLVRSTGFPKTSVLRLLASLERAGAVARDARSKRYHARLRLVPCVDAGPDLRELAAAALPRLAEATGFTAELYAWDGAMVMVDRCESEDARVRILARVGFQRDLEELDALGQIACVWGGLHLAAGAWVHVAGRRRALGRARREALLAAARRAGVARDHDLNENGVLRLAAPVLDADGALLGALAIARSWVPVPATADRQLAAALRAAVAELTPVH